MWIKCVSGVSFTIMKVSPLKCTVLLAVNAMATDSFIYIFCKNCVEPISRSGWVLPSAHAVWGGEGQDHQQVDHGQIITQPQRPLSIISAPQIYHTMVLSAVTHSLVIGCKMRQEDPTADTSMVTRPPHHTYTILVARLLQTQIQKLLWILQIFPYNS